MPAGVKCYTLCIRLTVICMKLVFHLFDLVQLLFITFVNQVSKYTLVIECLSLLFIIPLKLSFPHLVITLTTLETPKTSFVLVLLYSQNYAAGIRRHFHEYSDGFEHPQKSLLKSSHQHKYLPNFPTKKIPESKISNLKKSFHHPRHLKSRVPPLESLSYFGHYKHFSCDDLRNLLFCFFLLLV